MFWRKKASVDERFPAYWSQSESNWTLVRKDDHWIVARIWHPGEYKVFLEYNIAFHPMARTESSFDDLDAAKRWAERNTGCVVE